MPKPELGTKRTCLACGARFYDFGKSEELACPACGAPFDLEQVARVRRSRNPVRAVTPSAKKVEVDEDEVEDTDEEVDEVDIDEDEEDADEPDAVEPDAPPTEDEDDDDPLIEDADELGDDDALGEVIDPATTEDGERH